MDSKDAQEGVYEEIKDSEDDWINQALESVDIRSQAFLPAMGGLLVHIKGEGIVWSPRARVAGLLSKSGLLDTIMRHGSIIFSAIGFIFAPIGTAYAQFIRRGFRIPPNIVTSYSKSVIEQVLLTRPTLYQKAAYALIGAKEKLMSVIKKESKEKEDEEVTYYALRIINKLEEVSIEKVESSFLPKIENAIKRKLEGDSLPETSEIPETQPSPLETEITSIDSEENERMGKLKKLSVVKDRAVEKLKNAKEKLHETGVVTKEKLVEVSSYLGDKISKIEIKKIMRWLQGYPLFRIRLTRSETEKLHRFLKSLQEDGIEVYSALELEGELSIELIRESE